MIDFDLVLQVFTFQCVAPDAMLLSGCRAMLALIFKVGCAEVC